MSAETTRVARVEPIWVSIAALCVGLQEVPGPQSNPVILHWASDIGAPAWYVNDDQAWCAVAENRILLASQLRMAGTGFDLLRARTFNHYGQRLEQAALGAILVFDRPQGAHVGHYLGETETKYRVRGGNQGNAYGDAWIEKGRLMPDGIRWPPGVALPTTGPIVLAADGTPASSNEA